VVALAREHGWASDAHFTVDGTLIDAWASLKSFQPRTGPKDPDDGAPGNPGVDFHGQKRGNATHRSTTDAEAQLARKGRGKEARLCFGLHALMENRNGLCVQALITTAHGVTESTAAAELLARQLDLAERAPESLGADKGYHTAEVVGFCRAHGIKPHVARIQGRKVPGLDGRTTRGLGYQTSQKIRKQVEELLGWCKEIGGLRRTRKRGTARIGLNALLILTTCNLVRMGKLLGSPPEPEARATA
jgi:IS5 family transposase